jgi:hypothetical protein
MTKPKVLIHIVTWNSEDTVARCIEHARAQVLVDGAGAEVAVRGTISGGRFRVVVQNGAMPVTVESGLLDQPAEALVVRAAAVGVTP